MVQIERFDLKENLIQSDLVEDSSKLTGRGFGPPEGLIYPYTVISLNNQFFCNTPWCGRVEISYSEVSK